MIDGSCKTVPTESISSAYAGSSAAKQGLLMERNPLTKDGSSFSTLYSKYVEQSIHAVNQLGLSTTFETMESFHPASSIDYLLKEQSENSNNPFWPFFE